MKKSDCINFKQLVESSLVSEKCADSTKCFNYKPRLPKVTVKEVALKFWELTNDDATSGCSETKRFFGHTNAVIKCGGVQCGDCISLMTNNFNTARGY